MFLEMRIVPKSYCPKASQLWGHFRKLVRYTAMTTALNVQCIRDIVGKQLKQIHKSIYTIVCVCTPTARSEGKVELTASMR